MLMAILISSVLIISSKLYVTHKNLKIAEEQEKLKNGKMRGISSL